MKRKKKNGRLWTARPGAAVIGLSLALAWPWIAEAQSFVQPDAPPPFGKPAGSGPLEFLNGSSAAQRKLGSLLVGDQSGGDVLCLNANTDPGAGPTWIQDTAGCIASWEEAAGILDWEFLRLMTYAEALTAFDQGFVVVKNDASKSQLISFLVEASQAPSVAVGVVRSVSQTSSGYAAFFSGKVAVVGETHSPQLCLNGSCITDWSQAVQGLPADAVRLQSANQPGIESGSVGLNGPLLVGSLIAGEPGPESCFDILTCYSCGDNICSSAGGETSLTCPADCL